MIPLVIFGSSGHARVIADAARQGGVITPVGMLDPQLPPGSIVDGLPVHGLDDRLPELIALHPDLVGIIGIGDNASRAGVAARIAEQWPAFAFASVIHPRAVVAPDVAVGAGSFVAAGAIINCGSRLGTHVVVNTSASVDHDCILDDFAFVGPQAALAGKVTVGRGAFIGIGACIIPGVEIGVCAVVGAGAAVVRAVRAGTQVVGVPAVEKPDARRNPD